MSQKRLALGLDSSTQSLTAVVIDIDLAQTVLEHSLSYKGDSRLSGWGLDYSEMIIPPREPGEADQPPKLFLESVDAMFEDLKELFEKKGLSLADIVSINNSGQQHGHVYLAASARAAFAALHSDQANTGLVERLGGHFSYGTSPIWKTYNTEPDAAAIRKAAGGSKAMIARSGSDSPLRFTGAVIRRVGRQFPALYEATDRIHLISSFIPAVIAGNVDIGWDFGNGAGTSLMNYASRQWDSKLIQAASRGLPGGAKALAGKLPAMLHPLTVVGTVAGYFVRRYGLSADCKVVVGSGDNPQTKVLIEGDLLSLGTSFVMMASTAEGVVDSRGWANAMYDGLGRSFCFGCRTNGALVWDRVRSLYGMPVGDFGPVNKALETVAPGSVLRLWQPDRESFPLSNPFPLTRKDSQPADFDHDYAGVVDSSLGLLYRYSRSFAGTEAGKTLYIAGGPTANPFIVKRIAAIWNSPVVVIGRAGAALGTAVAAAAAISNEAQRAVFVQKACSNAINGAKAVQPDPDLVRVYHGPEGYLNKLEAAFSSLS